MPPFLGASGPLVTGIGVSLAVDTGAWWLLLVCFGLASGLFMLFAYMMPNNIMLKTTTVWKQTPKWARWSAYAALGLLAAGAMIGFLDPVRLGLLVGPVPVFFAGVALLVGLGTLLAAWSRESHLPLFSTVIVVLVLAQMVGDESTIRYLYSEHAKNDIGGRPFPGRAFDIWLKHHVPAVALSDRAAARQEGSPPGCRLPVVFVATAGGGSRAAYWSATVLGTLEDQTKGKFSDHAMAISGVSGGSLGAAIFRSLLPLDQTLIDSHSFAELGQNAAAGDFLGPVLATLFTHDLWPSFSDIWAPAKSEEHPFFVGDRAVALERSWEARWAAAVCGANNPDCVQNNRMAGSFLKLFGDPNPQPTRPDVGFKPLPPGERPWPALLLNGTAVETGGRIVTSNLKVECETPKNGPPCTRVRDVSDLLAHLSVEETERSDLDLRLSTAVSNSARFPFIGPAAVSPIAVKLPPDPKDPKKNRIRARLVDGGYFENFAATTLRELIATLGDRLKNSKLLPIVIQISSDPELDTKFDPGYGRAMVGESKISRFLAQLRSPLSAAYNTRDAHGAQARLALEDEAERIGARYFHFRLCSAQGSSRPPLAWVLSVEAQENIKKSLADVNPSCKNRSALAQVVACLETPTEEKCPPSF
jgi:predicted acylesterase/phospholipase RssA